MPMFPSLRSVFTSLSMSAVECQHVRGIVLLPTSSGYPMHSVNPFNHGLGDAERAVAATTKAAARRFNDEDSRFVLKQSPDSVLAQTPPICDLRDREMLLRRGRLGRHLKDGL